jgi:tetratricopeptide (TPR) repeat protein
VSAHDWILQAAVSYGSLGVAALLLLVGAGTVAIVRALRRRPTLGAVLLAVWCAYWTQALVTVGSISVDWVPWLTLGIAASITGRHARQLSPHRPARTLAIAAFVAATVLALSGAAAFAANRDALLTESADAATALRAAERAVARDPGRAMYWNRLGLARERGGDPAGAAVAYHEAARRAPYRATYWDNVAWSRLGAGDAAAAVEAADSAVSVDPFDPFSLYAAAEARRAAGDCDGALSAATGAMAIYHDGPGFSRSLARAALCSSDPGHARSVLEQAVRWDSAELHAALADLLYAGGDVERARQHATRALEIDPKNAVALTVLSALAASR